MDAASCSSPAFIVLQERLVVHLPGDAPGPEWVSIECASKDAYGCGELGERLLGGLTIHVRRLGHSVLNSSLSIRLSHAALRSIQAELGVPGKFQGVEGCLPEVDGAIKIASLQVLVLMVIFLRRNHTKRTYYLVYDAKDASLYMIPYIPKDLEATFSLTPVPARPAGGEGHELALIAHKFWPQRAERGRLCVCIPATRENPGPDGGTGGPWATKEHRFPYPRQAFSANVMFSLEDKVFWADLWQGVAYTDLRGGSCSSVFVNLPRGCRIDLSALPTDARIDPPEMSRTMGCVEGSIKFVCISRGVTRRRPDNGNEMVEVWALDLDRQEWKEEKGFPCLWKDLWKQTCKMDADLKLMAPLEPQYPVLTSDGALSLLLPNRLRRRKHAADYICSFDMITKSCLCLGRVDDYHSIIRHVIILPYNFFPNCCPAPLERKLPPHKRKLPSSVQVPMRRPAFVQQGRD